MTSQLSPINARTAELIAERRASLDATGEWDGPFAVHMILHNIERGNAKALARWLIEIERGEATYTPEERHKYSWLHRAANELLLKAT